jgi:flavin reductase (DIM6/NTAB) family NADH-FMN oxidoreductase RutF/rubredoxin
MILTIFGQKIITMEYKAFHKLSYGLYIIASEFEGKRAGYIGNTAFQVTSSPAQIAVSCHKNNETISVILKSGVFSLSVLRKEVSTSLIGEFGFMASSEIDKFAKVKVETHATGAPIVVDSVVAWFECRVVQTLDVGTHLLIIGEVVDSRLLSDEEPLTYDYYREKYKMLAPRNSPTYIEKEKLDAENKTVVPQGEVKSGSVQKEIDDDDEEHYICTICGYVYRPEDGDLSVGIPPGTPFSDLPEDYRCPICNAGKDYFKPLS